MLPKKTTVWLSHSETVSRPCQSLDRIPRFASLDEAAISFISLRRYAVA
jgi:hypothetical protein